jgi:hypothetical protein
VEYVVDGFFGFLAMLEPRKLFFPIVDPEEYQIKVF